MQLNDIFELAEKNGIKKRQIGIVLFGKENWRTIYTYKCPNDWQIRRNKKIEEIVKKLIKNRKGE